MADGEQRVNNWIDYMTDYLANNLMVRRQIQTEDEKRLYAVIEEIKGLLSRRAAKEMSMSAVLLNMPSVPEEDVGRLLDMCRYRGLHDCTILAAVRYNRIERLLLQDHVYPPPYCHLLEGNLLVDLAEEGLWPSWENFLSLVTKRQVLDLLHWLPYLSVNKEALTLFEMLLDRVASDRFWFKNVVENVAAHGHSMLYERILFGANIGQHLFNSGILRGGMINLIVSTSLNGRIGFKTFNKSLNDCLVLTCQAGLFTAPAETLGRLDGEADNDKSPMACAVSFNQPDVVRFLYSTGTISNREVFQLSQDADLVEKCSRHVTAEDLDSAASDHFPSRRNVIAAREIRSFLVAKASEPRSLQSLCLAEVSKGLGWGNARKAAVKELKIPLTFQNDLMANCDETLLRCPKKKNDK